MGSMWDDLASPRAYPGVPGERVERIETHVSKVHLLARDVFKVKKAVSLGFLDFSTPEARKAACDAEVELNRRLAPGVYLGVVPIVRGPDGAHRVLTGGVADGEIVEWAVHMTRLSDERRADRLLHRGALGAEELETVAAALARFHDRCRSDEATARHGTPEAIAVNVAENFAQTREALAGLLSPEEAREIEAWQTAFLRDEAGRFAARIAAGRVRDGHGDLRLEHVYLEPNGPIAIDCIEFADRFRFADVASDVAFLSMDLAAHDRVDLAEHLLAAYARESNDYDLYGVVDFYESYRAWIRGKIATIVAAGKDASPEVRQAARRTARRHFLLALSAERASLLRPVVVAVGGIIASGKSTLASWIGRALAAPVIEADRTRKGMLGVEATARIHDGAWSGAYDKGFTERVYEEMRRRARVVLASGRPVVLDASFRAPHLRLAAREVAREAGVPFVFVECHAPADVCKARLAARAEDPRAVSDGRLAIFDDFVREWQPPEELAPAERVRVDTSRPEEESHAELRARVATWPRGFVR